MILDGKKVSEEIIDNLKKERENIQREIKLAIIWVGDNAASEIYIRNKKKKCAKVGIDVIEYHLGEDTKEEEVIELIDKLNNDDSINGIILQSPVPDNIDIIKCFNHIKEEKDIDGFSCTSVGNLYLGRPNLVSCTPLGIIKLLDYYHINLEGANVCLINRSNIVGKPLFHLLLQRGATVTVCHSKTKDLESHTKMADIIISAVGKPHFITGDMIKDGAIVIDVGISRVDGKVLGDVFFDEVKDKVAYITPVPGGVGPMTVAMIIENIMKTVKEDK